MDLHDMCKRASTRLNIQWPAVQEETLRSRYDRKKLPQVKRARKQLLPVFLELLEELATPGETSCIRRSTQLWIARCLIVTEWKDTAYAVCPRWSLWWLHTSIQRRPSHPRRLNSHPGPIGSRGRSVNSVRALPPSSWCTRPSWRRTWLFRQNQQRGRTFASSPTISFNFIRQQSSRWEGPWD